MKQSIYLITIIVFVLFVSCNQNNSKEKEVLSWIGEEFIFIDTLSVFNPMDEDYCTTVKDILDYNSEVDKLVIYINAECFTCAQDLITWKEMFRKINIPENQIFIHIAINDLSIILPYLKKWKFKYPIIYDDENLIFTINKISNERLFQVFLLDKDNIIRFVGNPILDNILEKFYIDYFNNQR